MTDKTFQHFIDGAFISSREGRTFEKRRPIDNAVVGVVHEGGGAEVDAAVEAASDALKGPWGRMTVEARADLLRRIGAEITRRFDDFVAAEILDTG